MFKKLLAICLFLFPISLQAQTGYILYSNTQNGKPIGKPFAVIYNNGISQLNPESKSKEKSFVDYKNKETIQLVETNAGEYIAMRRTFDTAITVKHENTNTKILGYPVKKATYVVNSNTIEVFYNDQLKIKGTPSFRQLPQLGTVLKVITNGSRVVEAIEMKEGKYKNLQVSFPNNIQYVTSYATYNKAAIESRYTTINIFRNDTINFSDKYPKIYPSEKNKTYHYANGNIILKRIQLPKFNEDDAVFVSVTQKSGGDAYDRTGLVFAIPISEGETLIKAFAENNWNTLPAFKANNGKDYRGMISTKNYTVPFELMRFFTPFGVGAYNNNMEIDGYKWHDSAMYVQDITDLKEALSGKEVYMMLAVNNYNAGHIASMDLKIFPSSENKNAVAGASNFHKMLFNTTNAAESMGQGMADFFLNDSLKVTFTIEKPLQQAFLRYVSTGWGGWGNGDEFLPKVNDIFLNGKKIFSFVPWRSDCMTYRMLNPVSGNFSNGLSSSDLSRSNWCPGTTTNPVYIPLGDLQPGTYNITVAIPMSPPEGNSSSAWNVSGTLLGVQK